MIAPGEVFGVGGEKMTDGCQAKPPERFWRGAWPGACASPVKLNSVPWPLQTQPEVQVDDILLCISHMCRQ